MSKATDAINAAVNAVDENDPKLEELSLEELRNLADGKPADEKEQKIEPKEPVAEPGDEEDDEEPEGYEYTIDLQDGSGVQVFKGANVEEVMAKLVEAQKHATKKIREQAEQIKKYSAQAAKEAADNEYVYGQELITAPTAAFKKLFKETTGVDIDNFKEKWGRVEALETAQRVQVIEDRKKAAADQFLTAHPNFVANPSNGKRLEKACNLLIAEANSKNQEPDFTAILEAAFTDLSESGLLELKDAKIDEKKEEPSKRQTPTVAVVAHTRRASGLSSRARTVTTPKNTEPSEADLYEMPLDKLKELANKRD